MACASGDGRPRRIQQAFQSALAAQSDLSGTTVAAGRSSGRGYVQMVESSGANAAVYMLARSDGAGVAHWWAARVVYHAVPGMGGPGPGALGYPVSDRPAGGTQPFQNSAALAGNRCGRGAESSLLQMGLRLRGGPAARRGEACIVGSRAR